MRLQNRNSWRSGQRSGSAYGTILDGLREKSILPQGSHVFRAIEKAAEVLDAKKSARVSRMDDLLGFLLDEFPGIPSTNDVQRAVFNNIAPEAVDDTVVPLLVLSELLCGNHVWMDLTRCSNWSPFVERYGQAVFS